MGLKKHRKRQGRTELQKWKRINTFIRFSKLVFFTKDYGKSNVLEKYNIHFFSLFALQQKTEIQSFSK